MNSMFLFQIQGINHNSMLAGILWWAFAIATGLVGTSHLVAATSKQVLAFRLQKAGATFLLAGSLVGWSLLFQAMKPNTPQDLQSGHVELRPNAVAEEHYRTVMRSDYKAYKLITLEQAQKERLRMFC
ncbi:hypothetical protein V490_08035 [Pseudogymnoascus sp. VKM F-3557]|nr:hypothetical protein V490_08035 [Pseudogymnoascus sp. VKM F-3557]